MNANETIPLDPIPDIEEPHNNPNNKRRNIIVAVVAAVAIIAALVGVALYANYQNTKVGNLYTQVNAEGWNNQTSTPVELEIYQGDVKAQLTDEDEGNDPEAFNSVVMDANAPWGLEDVTERGTYTLSVEATPANEDGTLFKTPEPQVVTLEGNDVTVTFDLEKLDLATATAEEVEEATAKAEEVAKATGDESKVAAAAVASSKATQSAPSTSGGSNSGNSGGSSSGSSGGGNSGGGNSGGSGGSSSGHTHNYQPVYGEKQVPVYSTVTVIICNGCGMENPSEDHLFECGNGSTHNEYKKIQTGTKTETYIKYYQCSCGATK